MSNYDLAKGGHFMVTVAKFDPRVVCNSEPFPQDPTVFQACQAIVDQMDTSQMDTIFAQKAIYDPHLEVPLPILYTAPAGGITNIAPPSGYSRIGKHRLTGRDSPKRPEMRT